MPQSATADELNQNQHAEPVPVFMATPSLLECLRRKVASAECVVGVSLRISVVAQDDGYARKGLHPHSSSIVEMDPESSAKTQFLLSTLCL